MYDVGIIGAGPAGYTLAIRLSQKGKKVVLFEKNFVGGVCLNLGCIPTKTILKSCNIYGTILKASKFGIFANDVVADFQKIMERKNSVVEKMRTSLEKLILSYDIEIVYGDAIIINSSKIECKGKIYECESIVVATGSEPQTFAPFNELKNKDFILNSNDILNLKKLPKNLLIVGSGAIGTEWARIMSSLNVDVTLVELAENILPASDIEVSKRFERILKKNKVKIFTSSKVESIENGVAYFDNKKSVPFEKILLAVGRKPVLPKTEINFEFDINGKLKIDEHYQNSNNIYVIGDAGAEIQLAHNAIHQAIQLAGYLCENKEPEDFIVPSVIYGEPEIAWVGKTEQELLKEDINFKKAVYNVAALGKAQADGEIDGFVKLLSVDDVIVGAHIISPEASSLICEFILPIKEKLKMEKLQNLCHPHPTYSEASFEAILSLSDKQLMVMKGF